MTHRANPTAIPAKDRSLPLVTYVLMLFSVVTGATAVLALVIAVIERRNAPAVVRSHYDFIIQTFWVAFFSLGMVFALAGLFSFMGYHWLPSLARLVFLLISLWVVVRSVIGVLRLRDGFGMAPTRSLGVPACLDTTSAQTA